MPEAFKKQHIVPQAYLKHFATQSGGKYLIGTKVKPTSACRTNPFLASVSNIAYIENYYDTIHQKDPKHWEHYFADNFDTLCGQYLSNLISKITLSQPEKVVLTSEDKTSLSKIIMSQTIRVPALYNKVVVIRVPLQGHVLQCRGCCGLVCSSYHKMVTKRLQPQPFTGLLIS